MRRPAFPMILAAALFVLAGGYVHLREWLAFYRDIPAEVTGSAVVRLGFPLNAAASLVLAAGLVASVFVFRRLAPVIVAGSALFQVSSLAVLVQTRTGTVLGWSEASWTLGAKQTLAVEIGALACLAGVAIVAWVQPQRLQPVPVRAHPSS